MVTIANLVEKIIEEKPFIQEALSKGIINNAALAEQILPRVEKELKKKVKFSAVNMAIRRLSEKLEKTFIKKVKFDKNSHLNIRSNLIEITVFKTNNTPNKLKLLYDVINYDDGDFLTITQGIKEVMIIVDEKHEKEIKQIFSKNEIKMTLNNLSSITINIPINSIEVQGIFYVVTRALNWENINIVDIVSTLTEMTFILKEDDIAKAFNVLKDLIKKNN
jgi:aspartokinase